MKEQVSSPSIKNLFEPRPKIYKVVGDSFLYLNTAVAAIGLSQHKEVVVWIGLGAGFFGHLFTNLYAVCSPDDNKNVILPIDKNNI